TFALGLRLGSHRCFDLRLMHEPPPPQLACPSNSIYVAGCAFERRRRRWRWSATMTTHKFRQLLRDSKLRLVLASLAMLMLAGGGSGRIGAQTSQVVADENARPGTNGWDLPPGAGNGDPSIQGFATQISVNKGETVDFKITTSASIYSIDIYRLGYYQGLGARKIKTLGTQTGP